MVGPRCSPPTTTDHTDAADPKSMQQLLVWRRFKEAELAAKRKKAKREEEEEEDVEKASVDAHEGTGGTVGAVVKVAKQKLLRLAEPSR